MNFIFKIFFHFISLQTTLAMFTRKDSTNPTGNTTGNTTGNRVHTPLGKCGACNHAVLPTHRATVCKHAGGDVTIYHRSCYANRHSMYVTSRIKKVGSTIKTSLSWMFFFIQILFWVLICVVIPCMLYMYGWVTTLFKILQTILGDTTTKLYTENELDVIKDQARMEGLMQCNCSGISTADIANAAMITAAGVAVANVWPVIPAPAMNSLVGVLNTMSTYVTNDVFPPIVEYVGQIEVATRDEIWLSVQQFWDQVNRLQVG